MNETVTTIVGNVISDVRQRRTADGTRVVSFRVASNERRYDKASEQWVDGDRLFVTVTCWRRLAQGVVVSLVKGDPVVVTGRLYTRGYEVEGQKRSVTELEAVAVGPDLSRCFADLGRGRRGGEESALAQQTTEALTPNGERAVQDQPAGLVSGGPPEDPVGYRPTLAVAAASST